MSSGYTTITSKGQITLPAPLRRDLGLVPGQRLAVRRVGGHIEITAPRGIEALRDEIRRQATAAGTWGQTPDPNTAWSGAAAAKLGPADG
jgi:AbrB family looped-hinge helix DNA binding protein